VWVHLYAEGEARLSLLDGRAVTLVQRTGYPWDGKVEIEVDGEGTFGLYLRVPAWCESGASLKVNGQPCAEPLAPGAYAEIQRDWQPGDVVELNLPMPVRRVAAHPYVTECAGRVALKRGPILYCLEQADHPDVDLRDLVLPPEAVLSPRFEPELLGGVTVLRGFASLMRPDEGWNETLYRTAGEGQERPGGWVVGIRAVPYYAWANREPGAMRVWLRT
jgi:DUF1680 family protein